MGEGAPVMHRATPISPDGTALRRFEALGARRGHDRIANLFAQLAAGPHGHDLSAESLLFAEELTRMQPGASPAEERALALAALATIIGTDRGSTRVPLRAPDHGPGPFEKLVAALVEGTGLAVEPAEVARTLRALADLPGDGDRIIGGPTGYQPLVIADDCLYPQRMLQGEDALVDRLWTRIGSDVELMDGPRLDQALQAILDLPARRHDTAISLSGEQRLAVRAACARPLSLVTGGPGTGKTAIVVSILRVAHRLGAPPAEIALAGPTGKAAHRIAESVSRALASIARPAPADVELAAACPAPTTLHRLLGFAPSSGRFRHHENNPIPASLVIIDESSMIDLELMERLLRAVGPGSRLVLLGDAEQLPSIDAGAVFRDLVAALPQHTVKLTRSYRMRPDDPAGSHVLKVAAAINAGESPFPLKPPRTGGVTFLHTGGDPEAVLFLAEEWARARYFDHLFFNALAERTYRFRDGALAGEDRPSMDALFAHHEESRLLTVTRRFPTGSEAINAHLGRLMTAPRRSRRADLVPGEPLLMLRNDYDRGLFNGDQGVVALVAEDGAAPRPRAVFARSGTYTPYHLDTLRPSIERGYALTVHKSQGSEFGSVTLLLPGSDLPILTRELLYTAVTRARSSVVIAGTRPLLRLAVRRSVERHSGVAEKLQRRLRSAR